MARCKLLLPIFLIACTLLPACRTGTQSNTNDGRPDREMVIEKPSVDLLRPLELSAKPEDIELCKAISSSIDQGEFANARWGLVGISLKDGRVLCARDAQKLFSPASVQKLVTAVVALDKLGPDFKWQTRILSAEPIDGEGVLKGDLIIRGEGAPDLDANGLEKLVSVLKASGLKTVKGRVVGDDSYFKGDKLGDGWAWNEIQWYYGAESSALSYSDNQAEVSIKNGRPGSSIDVVEVDGEVKPPQDIEAIGLKRGLEDNRVYAWGEGKDLSARVAVHDPALWAAKTLKKLLISNGIAVEGDAVSRDWKQGPAKESVELASVESAPLREIVHKMNKDSVNLYAELMLRTLGKKFGSEAPDEIPKLQKLRGDDSAGATYIEKWLRDNNIASGDFQVHDGSGLSRLDMVSPEMLGRLLIYAAQSKFSAEFIKSLPVAGADGTMRGRLNKYSGRVLAKTGSITYVSSLAGYAENRSGEKIAFSIVCNNQTRRSDVTPMIDSIAARFAE